jgi:hypothetical protein
MHPILKHGEIKLASVRRKQKILIWNDSIARFKLGSFFGRDHKDPGAREQKITVSLSSDGEDNKKNNQAIYREL